MGLTIDNEAVVAMIRDLARRRGVTPDEAVRDAVERAVAQTPPPPRRRTPEEIEERYRDLMAIARRAHARPVIRDLTEDEILGYDENGIPDPMILETSALVAILTDEEGAAVLSARVAEAERVVVPAHVLLEASMVLVGRKTPVEIEDLDAYLARINAAVVPFTAAHALTAREAFLRYGKGRHPAALNFGDCMSYAVAQVEGLPLLYVGEDFARTDVAGA